MNFPLLQSAPAPSASSSLLQMVPFLLVFFIFYYFVLLAPMRKQKKKTQEHLAGGSAGPGRGDRRPRPALAHWPHPVHAASQEGAGAVAPRGGAARAQLHRHRTPSAEPAPRG